MIHAPVWTGVNRKSFFENTAFLSEIKYCSLEYYAERQDRRQVEDLKSTNRSQIFPLLRLIPRFLDDFALTVSGGSGPKHATAVSLELSEDRQTHILRVARNMESCDDVLQAMKELLTSVFEASSNGKIDLHSKQLVSFTSYTTRLMCAPYIRK